MNIFKHTFMYRIFASIHSVSAMSKIVSCQFVPLSLTGFLHCKILDQQLCGHGCSPSIPTCYKMKVVGRLPSCITSIKTSQSLGGANDLDFDDFVSLDVQR